MTPLLLLAGFLGAGKTTFLRALLSELPARGLRARVLLNDFQNARVDAATLKDLVPDIVALAGNCLCCETLADLLTALAAIEAAPGQLVLVETHGATDTGPLLELVGADPGLAHLSPPLQLTVVDAQRFGRRGWQNEMEREQIQTATHLVISRLDVVAPERRAEVEQAVAALAPRAAVMTPAAVAAELEELERSLRGLSGRAGLTNDGAAATTTPDRRAPSRAHRPADHFASLQLPLPGPVDEAAFLRFLQELPPEVLRAKGIVQLREPAGEKRSFQKVDGEAEVSPCQLADPDEIAPVAVFVGPRLPSLAIRARLARLFQG